MSVLEELKEKIGQKFMIGISGPELKGEEERFLSEHPMGGFILFERNLKSPEQILALCRRLWHFAPPPFIAIDHEGGRVHRLPQPFTRFPAAALLGRTLRPELARNVGEAQARELLAVGINLNFSPVLDVLTHPANAVIGDRALGSEPGPVKKLGWALAEGLRAGGIIPCGKHFPGHGGTAEDSHLTLPVSERGRAELEATDLPPFLGACRSGIEALMTAHVLYPALDRARPATLSRVVVTGLLREEWGYEGVVFGDDMEMRAIRDRYPAEEAGLLGTEAGVDVMLFCHTAELAAGAFERLCRSAEADPGVREQVERSLQRIRRLKQRRLREFKGVEEGELKSFVGLKPHRKLVEEIHGSL